MTDTQETGKWNMASNDWDGKIVIAIIIKLSMTKKTDKQKTVGLLFL